ncbi:hypothetical protein [Actinophytocola glycyrrhizae]|uniref:Uncharacterized protein n=1 Tax=Actinophytocola glycyrrhizae TaxID=2044873 RepID=A0ABV9S179_9PSEU
MYGRLFTLVDSADHDLIFAWGMEIVGAGEREAVIYRRDPVTRRTTHAVHGSAAAALARYTARPEPMALVWMDLPEHIGQRWDLLTTVLNP